MRCFLAHTLMNDYPDYASKLYGVHAAPRLAGVLSILHENVPLHRWRRRELLFSLLQQVAVIPPPMLMHTLQLHVRNMARLRLRQAWRLWRS